MKRGRGRGGAGVQQKVLELKISTSVIFHTYIKHP